MGRRSRANKYYSTERSKLKLKVLPARIASPWAVPVRVSEPGEIRST